MTKEKLKTYVEELLEHEEELDLFYMTTAERREFQDALMELVIGEGGEQE